MNIIPKTILFLVLFIDLCNPSPRSIALSDLDKACESELTRRYVRLAGHVLDEGDVECFDRPGGVHCRVWLGDDRSGNGAKAPVVIKAFSRRPEFQSGRSVIMLDREPPADFKPFTVRFDEIEIYDRDGGKVDYKNEPVVILGPLERPSVEKGCSQRALHVERQG